MMDFEKIDFSDDLLKGDHSFTMWFKIMWRNWFIQLFVLCLVCIATILCSDMESPELYIGLAVPIASASVICYKGFYQFWNDLKNNRSR